MLPAALLPLAVLVVVLPVALLSRRRLRTTAVTIPPELATGALALGGRQRRVLTWALGTGAAVGLYAAIVQVGRPDLVGLPVLLAPVLAAAAVLLVLVVAPPSPPSGLPGPSDVDTEGRPWSFAPRWGFVLPASAAVLLLGYLALTAGLATPDDGGRMRAYTLACPSASMESTATPYPGGFYGGPLALGAVAVVVLAAVALARIARRPRVGGPETAGLDDALRAASTRAVLGVAAAGVLLPFGAVLILAGAATYSVARNLDGACSTAALSTGAWTQNVVGLLLVVLGTGLALAVPVTARTGLRTAAPAEGAR
ncbi:MAG TPA: hypothetical protein VGD11_04470 [Mycobacteriales bacterium]